MTLPLTVKDIALLGVRVTKAEKDKARWNALLIPAVALLAVAMAALGVLIFAGLRGWAYWTVALPVMAILIFNILVFYKRHKLARDVIKVRSDLDTIKQRVLAMATGAS